MAPSQDPTPKTWGFSAEYYTTTKPAGFVEQPKPKTRRVGLGKVIVPVDTSPQSKESAVKDSATPKKPEATSFAAVLLNQKAKAMMEEGDKRSAHESSLLKKEQKRLADKAKAEAYAAREAKRQADHQAYLKREAKRQAARAEDAKNAAWYSAA